MKKLLIVLAAAIAVGCSHSKKSTQSETAATTMQPTGPTFQADSAFEFCRQQCDFGPRVMNSDAHERCGKWIVDRFHQYGMAVTLQQATLHGYDGTPLRSTNIIASYRPDCRERVLVCAHWDSRPWADNDPDEANHRLPVMAANDGASGVAVMLEIARLLQLSTDSSAGVAATMAAGVGVDFVCLDAEDWGTPQWADTDGRSDADTWALGAQYWAAEWAARQRTTAADSAASYRYGILLDMVGGQGARFYQEQVSAYYAPQVVKRVWAAAEAVGFGSFFPRQEGGAITDDHVPINQTAKIPCIDIIPYYPDCRQSSFGPTWHTTADDLQHIDKQTLQAVGQTMVQVLFTERD